MLKYTKIEDIEKFLYKYGLCLSHETGGTKKYDNIKMSKNNEIYVLELPEKVYVLSPSTFINTIKQTEKKTKTKLFGNS